MPFQFKLLLVPLLWMPFCDVQAQLHHDSVEVFKSMDEALLNPDAVQHLKLKRCKLEEWPLDLTQFKNLLILDLSHNKIADLPADLSAYSNLMELNLTGNKLDSVPDAIGDLTGLKVLKLGNNEIYHTSERIGNLKNLEYLELWSNNIYYLPHRISELEHLMEVDVRGIQMSEEHQDQIKALLMPQTKLKISLSCNCD